MATDPSAPTSTSDAQTMGNVGDLMDQSSDYAQSGMQVKGTNYAEVASSRTVPTKTGEEEAVIDAQLDSERPGSAGTTTSAPLDDGDHVVLENCSVSATPMHQDEVADQARLLSRTAPDVLDPIQAFSFAKAPRIQLGLTTSRNGAAPTTGFVMGGAAEPGQTEAQELLPRPEGKSFVQLMDLISADITVSQGLEINRELIVDDFEVVVKRQVHDGSDLPEVDKRASDGPAPSQSLKPRKAKRHTKRQRRPPPSESHLHPDGVGESLNKHYEHQKDAVVNGGDPVRIQHLAAGEDRQAEDSHMAILPSPSEPEQHAPVTTLPGADAVIEAEVSVADRRCSSVAALSPHDNAAVPVPQLLTYGGTNQSHHNDGHDRTMRAAQTDGFLHQVSSSPSDPRVSKRKTKRLSKRIAARPDDVHAGGTQETEISDYMHIMLFKLQESRKESANRTARLQAQLQDTIEAKEQVEKQLIDSLQERDQLSKKTERQDAKMSGHREKFDKLMKFASGLGNDIKTLRDDTNRQQRTCEEYMQKVEDVRAQRQVLITELAASVEESRQLKNKVVKLSRDAQSDLQHATLACEQLKQQVSEKAILLDEERHRRLRLERLAESPVVLSAATMYSIQSPSNEILEILRKVQTAVKDERYRTEITDLLETTHAAVLSLTPQTAMNTDEVEGVKAIMNQLSQRIGEEVKAATSRGSENLTASFKGYIDEAVETLQEGLRQNRDHMDETTANVTNIASLQDELTTCYARISEVDSKALDVQKTIDKLNAEKSDLQAKITDLQRGVSPEGHAQAQLVEMELQLQDRTAELESAQAESSRRANELNDLITANGSLQEQVQILRTQIDDFQNNAPNPERDRARIAEEAQERLRQSREEMNRHVKNFETELKTRASNDLKRLSGEKSRFEKQVQSLTKDLSTSKTQIEELRKHSSADGSKDEEIRRLREILQRQEEDSKTLQGSLTELQGALKGNESLKEEHSAVLKQLEGERHKACVLDEQNCTSTKELEDLQRTIKQSAQDREDEKSELERRLAEKAIAIDDLEAKLSSAKEAAERAVAGLECYKKSSRKAVGETKEQAQEKINSLQGNLSDAQAELQRQRDKDKEFQAQVEQSWQNELKEFEKQKTELGQQLVDVKEQLKQAKLRAEVVEEKLRSKALGLDGGHDPQNLRQNLSSDTEHSAKGRAREQKNVHEPGVRSGSIIEDSQPAQDIAHDKAAHSAPRSVSFNQASDNEDMLSVTGGSPVLTSMVPETQSQDGLPSFAVFNKTPAKSSQTPTSHLETSTFKVPLFGDSQASHRTRMIGDPATQSQTQLNIGTSGDGSSYDFSTFEDSLGTNGTIFGSQVSLQNDDQSNGLRWSQPETDKYTFQKAYPQPNSASKVVRRDTKSSGQYSQPPGNRGGTVSTSGQHDDIGLRNGTPGGSQSRLLSAKTSESSSPSFIQPNAGREFTTYSTPGPSAGPSGQRRRSSGQSSIRTVDPRLPSRNAPGPMKRKAERQTSDGEYRQSKRQTATTNPTHAPSGRILRSGQQSSVSKPPSSSGPTAGPASSQGCSQGSRVRHLAGASTRSTGRTKRSTQSNLEKSAFFDQHVRPR